MRERSSTSLDLTVISPLPIVNLQSIGCPSDGLLIDTPKTCRRNFHQSEGLCRRHYEGIASSPDMIGKFVPCPYGFTSYVTAVGRQILCFTSIIPFPRNGTEKERTQARRHPECRQSREAVLRASKFLNEAGARAEKIESRILEQYALSLHEIRKLNRTVKQQAERLCKESSPDDPDVADPRLVRIWKTSEIMSQQFDVIEILANERLASLPCNSVSEIYRIVDKCVRIYRHAGHSIDLRSPSFDFHPRIHVCDKTFHIIPMVLIENALKYSVQDSEIVIEFSRSRRLIAVTISNVAILGSEITDRVFERGYRGSSDVEGSGNGLYLARLVAKQHNATLTVSTRRLQHGQWLCRFCLTIPEVVD